jgi:hypothetical protein
MLKVIIFTLFLTAVSDCLFSSEILNLIKSGQLDEAKKLIAQSATATRRDGNMLYYQAIMESDGATSVQFLEAAFKAELSPEYLEDNIYRMAMYYLAKGDYEKAASTSEAYLLHWENGKFRAPVQRLASVAYSKLNQEDKANHFLKRLERENDSGEYGFISKMDRARKLYNEKSYLKAQKICRNLRVSKFDPVVVPSLYMLSFFSLEQKRVDDAILYYNILKERYPYAVGLDDLITDFGKLQNVVNDNQAEKITGTIYSVQVGVFSKKSNARDMSKRFKKYGKNVEIQDKTISDKKYYVVYVGRFTSSNEALAFKEQLTQMENEAYHVVAR